MLKGPACGLLLGALGEHRCNQYPPPSYSRQTSQEVFVVALQMGLSDYEVSRHGEL